MGLRVSRTASGSRHVSQPTCTRLSFISIYPTYLDDPCMDAWSFSDVLCVGITATTLLVLYCMIIARTAGKGSQRLSAAVIPPSRTLHATRPSILTPSKTPLGRQTWTTCGNGEIHNTMLRAANKDFVEKNARAQRSSQDYFKSSPPEVATQQKPSSQTANPSYRNPLKPASASAVNGRGMFAPRTNSTTGFKRTASGLAKLDGAFDDGPGSSAHQPIMVGGGTGGVQTQVSFDENDFDSDIELDVEEPKTAVSYPKLPPQKQQRTMAAPPKPAVYPTLEQQASRSLPDVSRRIDSGHNSHAPTKATHQQMSPPKSSAEFPWSSSPAEHFEPTQPVSTLGQFAYSNPTTQARQDDPPPAAASKRRKLPWHQEGERSTSQEPTHSMESKRRRVDSNDAARIAKESMKAIQPWNTSASDIKDKQKKLRQENKKAVKKNEGTEETITKAKSTRTKIARVFLSEEQQHVLGLVSEAKQSVFFTGSAGTGKSVLLRETIASLRRKYTREPDRVAVTASTGLAACNVGGVTLHSFAGIGLGKEDIPELVRKIKRNQKAKQRWLRTKVLVIDEISMVDAELYDKLEGIARQLRNNGRPFGGIQLVITGDFFQLPPVPEGSGRVSKFAFDAATWRNTIQHTILLHHVFRQKDPGKPTRRNATCVQLITDILLPVFAGMLNELREGRLSKSSVDAFRNLSRPMNFNDALEATELFPTRNEVDRANRERLHMLQGHAHMFEARDGGTIVDKGQRDRLLSNCMAPEQITLKKGSQVMLIKNIDDSLVNGSIGQVIGFMDEAKFDRYHNDEEGFMQSQGGTIPESSHDAAGLNPEQKKVLVHAVNGSITTSRQYPVVRFVIADGTTRDLLCQPENWKIELPSGEIQASRNQVPLILAWALSIHKAQGQTLERVKVDLGKVFEKGQAYVALSRATTMSGLQVLRFDPKRVQAHEKVADFYRNLSRVEELTAQEARSAGAKGGKGARGASAGVRAEEYEKMFLDDELE